MIVNKPVAGFKVAASDGLNCFWNIGFELLCKAKLVLFDLVPLIASYCANDNDSVTVPYCKSGGMLRRSVSE